MGDLAAARMYFEQALEIDRRALGPEHPTVANRLNPSIPRWPTFEPPNVSPRIENQYALFSVMPRVRSELQSWLTKHKDVCWKVVIHKRLKKEIRERLLVMNVSERTIYPGLDGTSRWLAAWYR